MTARRVAVLVALALLLAFAAVTFSGLDNLNDL